nr:putative ribosomal large subunit pseudouridine synthase SVR1, chloroplastic [Ipomoea batatas]
MVSSTLLGEFAHKLSHPPSNLSKEYIATIDGEVNKRHLIAISEGTVIEGIQCTLDLVELLPKQPDISRPRLHIVVKEVYEILGDMKKKKISSYIQSGDYGSPVCAQNPTKSSSLSLLLCLWKWVGNGEIEERCLALGAGSLENAKTKKAEDTSGWQSDLDAENAK